MTKPFDLNVLLAAFKSSGLADVEKTGRDVLASILNWLFSSITLLAKSQPLWQIGASILNYAMASINAELVVLFGPGPTLALSIMSMPKAFDLPSLFADMKARGIVDAEAVGQDVLGDVFGWLTESITLLVASQPIWGIAIPLLDAIEPSIEAELASLEASLAPAPAAPVTPAPVAAPAAPVTPAPVAAPAPTPVVAPAKVEKA